MFNFQNIGVMELLAAIICIGLGVLIALGRIDATVGTGAIMTVFTALGTFRRIEVGQQIKAAGIESVGKPPAP